MAPWDGITGMFNESEYQTVWLIYLAAAAVGWLVWWKMTRWIGWWFVREPLQLLMAVLLFTPAAVEQLKAEQAPAAIIWVLDTLFGTGDNQGRMLAELALVASIVMAAWVAFACLRLAWRQWRRQTGEQTDPA